MTLVPNNRITKAVFPVAGLGTRFLPTTKASPKEMLSIVDKPLIQYAVEEAIAAGIDQLIFITGRSKRAIEDHFDTAYELESELEAKNKIDLLQIVRNIKPSHVDCIYIRQSEALGLGHAILCAEKLIQNEYFAVLLADDLIDGEPSSLSQMLDVYKKHYGTVLAVEKIEPSQSTSYGMIKGELIEDRVYKLEGVVEKPQEKDAPSDLAIAGRYILSSNIFEYLRTTKPGAGGEIQLTDGISALLKNEAAFAYEYKGLRFDCGSKLGYLKASVEFALRHPEIGEQFESYLKNRFAPSSKIV